MINGGRAGGILSIPAQEVSLGSPRVGTIHAQAPTPHTPPLQSFLVDFSHGCCLGPAWFRIPSWLGLASPGSNAQFVGIIPPIVCINMAIRTYENKSFF